MLLRASPRTRLARVLLHPSASSVYSFSCSGANSLRPNWHDHRHIHQAKTDRQIPSDRFTQVGEANLSKGESSSWRLLDAKEASSKSAFYISQVNVALEQYTSSCQLVNSLDIPLMEHKTSLFFGTTEMMNRGAPGSPHGKVP